MIRAEPWLIIVGIIALFFASIRIHKFIVYLKRNGFKGVGATLIVLGAIFAAIVLSHQQGWLNLHQAFLEEWAVQVSIALVVIGALSIIADWFLQKFLKKELLDLEDERREYITRVRKGITIENAEKLALKHAKNKLKRGDIEIIASEKEFKTWTIYLKDGPGHKYKLVLDIEGEILKWEKVDALPSYLSGPY